MALAKRRGEFHCEEGNENKTEGKSHSVAQSAGPKAKAHSLSLLASQTLFCSLTNVYKIMQINKNNKED